MTAEPARRLFTVSDYYRMAEAGILGEDDRVELIEGEIVQMPPIGSNHAGVINRLIRHFTSLLADQEAIVSAQNPVRLDDISEPVPDFAILEWRDDYYRSGHPLPQNVLLLLEVADSTLRYDIGMKATLYARAGIAEYWVLDVNASTFEVFRHPGVAGYQTHQTARRGDMITPEHLARISVSVSEILG